MKRWLFLLLLTPALCFAGPFSNYYRSMETSTSLPSDVLFFWTCESETLGSDDYTAGDTTATQNDDVAINSDAAKTGTNGVDVDDTGSDGLDRYSFDLDEDSINPDNGVIGFWFRVTTWSNNAGMFSGYLDSSNRLEIKLEGTTGIEVFFGDGVNNNDISITGLSTGTWYFLEYIWDVAADSHTLKISTTTRGDQVDTTENETLDAISLASASQYVGNSSSNADGDFHLDLIMVSNDKTRNLFNWRTATKVSDIYE
jgi:hypothetical protein